MTGERDESLEFVAGAGDDQPVIGRIARALALSVVVWTFLAIPLVYQVYMANAANGRVPPPRIYIGAPMTRYLLMAVLTLPIFWLTWRFPFRRKRIAAAVLAHIAGFVTFFVVFAWLRHIAFPLIGIPMTRHFGELLTNLVQRALVEQVWAYLSIVIVAHAVQFARDARNRAVGEAELRAELARQQMQILKLQLHPHFLFNCLHGISSLMDSDIDKARTAIARFSDLLRVALQQTSRDEIRLDEELAFVDSYLSLEKLRLGDRLRYTVHVDAGLEDVIVPTMVLQPLVENAIRHGIEKRVAPGKVEIYAQADGSRLRIGVVNDCGRTESATRTGVGLSNTRGRLRTLYGSEHELTMTRREDERIEVTALLPLRRAVAELAS